MSISNVLPSVLYFESQYRPILAAEMVAEVPRAEQSKRKIPLWLVANSFEVVEDCGSVEVVLGDELRY
jgi:hypothetical protein